MFFLADKAKANIIPVTLKGTFEIMPMGSSRVRPGTVEMIIDKPVAYKKDKQLLEELHDLLVD